MQSDELVGQHTAGVLAFIAFLAFLFFGPCDYNLNSLGVERARVVAECGNILETAEDIALCIVAATDGTQKVRN